jgi:excisionase family DNA binding protein
MSSPNPRGRPFTVRDAAGYLGLPTKTVYRLCALRQIGHYRSDGRLLERRSTGRAKSHVRSGRIWFYQADLDVWLDNQRVSCGQAPPAAEARAPTNPVDLSSASVPTVRRFA